MTSYIRSITPEKGARFLGLMLVAWQPFTGGARLPSVLLLLLGGWLLFHKRIDLGERAVRRLAIVFLLLLGPILLSLPGSFNPFGTLNVALALSLFFVAGLALMAGLASELDHAWLQRWLSIVLMGWLADACIQFVFGHDLLGIPMAADGRLMGLFPDNLHFGLFITVLMPVMLWRIASKWPRAVVALIALIGFVAAMSGARSNLLFYLLAVATLMPRLSWWQRGAIVLAVLVGVAGALVQSETTASKFKQFSAATEEKSLFQRLDHMLSNRMIIWETAATMVRDRPLAGVGAGAFAQAYDHYATRPEDPFRTGGSYTGGVYHAHQMYVSIAAESGICGLAGIVATVGLCVAWFLQATEAQRAHAAPYAASLAVIAFPIQSQPVLFTLWWFPVVLLLLCGMLSALSSGTRQH